MGRDDLHQVGQRSRPCDALTNQAGVARGLLHHYFGDKRTLQREAVRSMLRYPELPESERDLSSDIGGWLTMVSRNRAAWLAALAATDPDVRAVVDAARDDAVERLVARFGTGRCAPSCARIPRSPSRRPSSGWSAGASRARRCTTCS